MLGERNGFLSIFVFRTALDSCRVLRGSSQIWRVEKCWLVTSALALVDCYPGFSAGRGDGPAGGAPKVQSVDSLGFGRHTDSLRVAFKHRMMVQAKLQELFLRKVLLDRWKNFVPRHPLARIDPQVLYVLAEAHKIVELAYLGLRKHHKIVWTLPGPSNLFLVPNEDTKVCSVLSSPKPTVNQCIDLVVHSLRQIIETIPYTIFRAFQHGQHAEQFCGLFEEALIAEVVSHLRELVMSKRGKVVTTAAEKGRVAVVIDTETTVGIADAKSVQIRSERHQLRPCLTVYGFTFQLRERKQCTEVLGDLAACGLLDRVRAGAAVIKPSSGILPVQETRGDIGV
ncbi:hypothetical protein F511_39005 [Dorcoceras hygrometricum]|uniref:Uncharacterized protein n=1 Tax=Dorcoceras hygrometricum TaxID=472368 RepID=A0A2Z7CWN0_9LAMI|nr:hypothetical protein F511_39005 [Dorcoceras hygrometricum]